MNKYLKILISSILAGMLITVGTTVYLSMIALNQKVLGSFLFGIGLFTIISFNLWLYTGKVGFLFDKEKNYILELLVCLIGNILGAFLLSYIISLTRYGDILYNISLILVDAKQNDTWYSVFILSILCGMLIYIAVKGQEVCKDNFSKCLIIFLSVMVFILSGFEHVIANVSYYTFASKFDLKVALYILLMVIGNSIGSILLNFLYKITYKTKNN